MEEFQLERDIIKRYIENRLQRKLEKDQKELRILSEGDLQSCVYYHLRNLFRKKKISDCWYLTNKLAMGKQRKDKMFPDIVIMFKRDTGGKVRPIFLIELKEHESYHSQSVKDDLEKLKHASRRWDDVVQTYFILAAPDKNLDSKKIIEKMETVQNKIKLKKVFLISVNVFHKLKGSEPGKWQDNYKRLKKLH